MFSRTTRREIATIDYSANNTVTTQLTGLTGRVRSLYGVLEGSLTVTTAGTNYLQTRNPGTLIPSLTLRLNNSQVLKQGAWNDWRDRGYCFTKTGEETKVTAATAATYPFVSRVILPFNTPRSAKPIDTILQLGTNDRLDLDLTFADDEALVASSTTQSWATTPTVTVVGEIEAFIPDVTPNPIGVYKESTTEWNIGASAVSNWQNATLIVAPNLEYHSIIMVEEDAVANTGRARVSTITDVTLQQQGGGYVSQPFGLIEGLDMQHWYNQRNRLVDSVRTGVYPICWQADAEGRITYNLDTSSLDDLRLILTIADPGANGFLRVLTGTIERF
jgi:hypothetical protein